MLLGNRQKSLSTTSSHQVKCEDSNDTDSDTSDDLGNATDEDEHGNRYSSHYTAQLSFFRRYEGTTHPGKDSQVPSEEHYDRLM